jgi:hypothetical protein
VLTITVIIDAIFLRRYFARRASAQAQSLAGVEAA